MEDSNPLTQVIWMLLILFVYFLPGLVAISRKHRSKGAIQLVNLLFGWTVVGWFWSFIWAFTGNVQEQGEQDPTMRCPYCAETIKRAATICRFCGKTLSLTKLAP